VVWAVMATELALAQRWASGNRRPANGRWQGRLGSTSVIRCHGWPAVGGHRAGRGWGMSRQARGGSPKCRLHRGVSSCVSGIYPGMGGHSHLPWENNVRRWPVPGVYRTPLLARLQEGGHTRDQEPVVCRQPDRLRQRHGSRPYGRGGHSLVQEPKNQRQPGMRYSHGCH